MHNPQILSSQSTSPASSEQTTPQTASAPPVLIFDACHLGVVLRAVLGVELTLAIAALYTSADAQDWLLHMAWLTSGGLPGTLVWLLLACSLKRVLHRMDAHLQYASGVGLGVGAGLYASAMLVISGLGLILFILLHSGKGTGISDMIASSVYSSQTGTSIVEKNLDRITIIFAVVFLLSLIALMIVYPSGTIATR